MEKRKLRLIILLSAFTICILFPGSVGGWGRKPPEEPKTVEEKVARKFHVEDTTVLALKDKGYETEEVIKVLILAAVTAKRPDEISILRDEGMDWEEITKRFGIEIDTLSKETQELLFEVEGKKEVVIEESPPEIELEIEKELKKKLEMEETKPEELEREETEMEKLEIEETESDELP